MKKIVFSVASFLFIAPFCWADTTASKKQEDNFLSEARMIDKHDYRTAEQAGEYRRIFEKYYGDVDQQRNRTADQLIDEFNASALVFFYTLDDKYIKSMRRALEGLDSKNLAKRADHERMYRSLIAAHDYNEAKKLNDIKKLGHQDTFAIVRDTKISAERSEWLVSKSNATLTKVEYKMPDGPVVIMITQPNCHFSQNAIRDIEKDSRILARMQPITKFIAPPSINFNLSDYQKWNSSKPQFSISVMHKVLEWPELTDWATPNFYFFKDRRLVAAVTGWPAKGHISELDSALDMIGAK